MSAGSNRYFYVRNAQNDIIALIDENGTEVVRYEYDAWGNPISTTGTLAGTIGKRNPFRYRGYYWDEETGMYYLESRYYDPEIRQFISADSVVITSLAGTNLYMYCGNNPVNMADPSGHFMKQIFEKIKKIHIPLAIFMFEWASVAKGAFLDLSKMRLAIDTFKRSETINNLIEDNIHKMQKTGLKEWTYNDSLHFYDRENSYDFDLSFAVGKAKYSMHIEEYKFRQFPRYTAYRVSMRVYDKYDFEQWKLGSFTSYINNFGYACQEVGVLDRYNWECSYETIFIEEKH